MKIKNKEYVVQGNKVTLSEIAVSLLRDIPSGGGVEAARKQVTLYKKLEECNGEIDITPEDAVLIRSILDRPNILLTAQTHVDVYDSFNPENTID